MGAPMGRPKTASWGIYLQYAIVCLVVLAPIAWMVLASFKPPTDVTAYPPKLVFDPVLENYATLLETTPFAEYALNSLIVAGGSTILGLLLGVPAAFGVSYKRISWPATVTLMARMAPGTLFLLPWYVFFSALGLVGSHAVLILTHTVITMPMILWIMLPYFDGLPRELYESATVDGASIITTFLRIALPLVVPGVVVAAILAFVFSWNYFLFALVLSGFDSKTLIVAAFNFVGEGATNWGALMAAAVLIALPPVVLALVVQRWLISGLTAGAVKG